MSMPWKPDYLIDRALVETVLASQTNGLDLTTLTHVDSGWDHEVWRCDDIVFRFPHQAEAHDLAASKSEVLLHLADVLPCSIPTPTHVGVPTGSYPGRFVGYRWVPGQIPARLRLSQDERCLAAEPLALTFRTLHSVPRQFAEEFGVGTASIEGELALRTENGTRRAAQLVPTAFRDLARSAAAAMTTPPAEVLPVDRCLVHGDMHAGQLLFDRRRRFVAIIDWDEISLGDPAYDLMLVYAFLPKVARPRFWSIYGPFSGQERARHVALSCGLAILAQAVQMGQEDLRDEAAFSLENAMS